MRQYTATLMDQMPRKCRGHMQTLNPILWEFRKLGLAYLEVLKNKDPTIYGTPLGSPIFGNPHMVIVLCSSIGHTSSFTETGLHCVIHSSQRASKQVQAILTV